MNQTRPSCESCGKPADVQRRDGATWCTPCDVSAVRLGYPTGGPIVLVYDENAAVVDERPEVDEWWASRQAAMLIAVVVVLVIAIAVWLLVTGGGTGGAEIPR